jgi:nucleolar protein 58
MLVLYETAMGYCLFKISDNAQLEEADLYKEFETPERANKLCVASVLHIALKSDNSLTTVTCRLRLKALHRFTSTATAVEDITALQNGKIGKGLKKFLTSEVLDKGKGKDAQQLVVVDPHLGQFDRRHGGQNPTDFVTGHNSTFYLEKTQHQRQIRYNRKH